MTSYIYQGTPIPHLTNGAAVVIGGTAGNISGTSAAAYVTTTGGATNSTTLNTNRACVRMVHVYNASTAGQVLYFNVGNTVSTPPTAVVLGSFPIIAGEHWVFSVPDGGSLIGGQGLLSAVSSAAGGSAVVNWLP